MYFSQLPVLYLRRWLPSVRSEHMISIRLVSQSFHLSVCIMFSSLSGWMCVFLSVWMPFWFLSLCLSLSLFGWDVLSYCYPYIWLSALICACLIVFISTVYDLFECVWSSTLKVKMISVMYILTIKVYMISIRPTSILKLQINKSSFPLISWSSLMVFLQVRYI